MNEKTDKVEKILPFESTDNKGKQVELMFDHIADNYDQLNSAMSLGMHNRWRRRSLKRLADYAPASILDIACGTGDMAIEAYKILQPETIEAVDLSLSMLQIARSKAKKTISAHRINFSQGDCMSLPFADSSFDAATVAFGVRNFENLEQGISEIYRLLHPQGKLLIVELSQPQKRPLKAAYSIYTKVWIPLLAKIMAANRAAYSYLPRSVKACPQGEEMLALAARCGFKPLAYRTYTLGVCSMYLLEK